MDRINGANTADIGGGRRGFRAQNAAAGISGTELVPTWFNDLQEEVMTIIETAGIVPAAGAWNQLYTAIAHMIAKEIPSLESYAAKTDLIVHRGPGGGTADALTATVTPAVTGYVDGDIYEIAPVATSTTTAPTLAVSGLAAKTIAHADGSPVLPGELVIGTKMLFAYSAARDKIILLGTPKAYVDKIVAALLPAHAAGWLHNDGAGALSWTTPSAAGAYTYGGIGTAISTWFDGSSSTVEGDPLGTYSPGPTLPALGSTITMSVGGLSGTYKLAARSPAGGSAYLLSYVRVA